jgi:hypothetical protein
MLMSFVCVSVCVCVCVRVCMCWRELSDAYRLSWQASAALGCAALLGAPVTGSDIVSGRRARQHLLASVQEAAHTKAVLAALEEAALKVTPFLPTALSVVRALVEMLRRVWNWSAIPICRKYWEAHMKHFGILEIIICRFAPTTILLAKSILEKILFS